MKQNYFKKRLLVAFVLTLSMFGFVATAQITIANGGVLHYAGGDFASGIIDNTAGGTFSISASYAPDDANYVKGVLSITGAANTYTLSLENGAKERNLSVTTTGATTVTVAYSATATPLTATSDFVFPDSNTEVYTFTEGVTSANATPLDATKNANFPKSKGEIVLVYENNNTWSNTASEGITKMTFAKEKSTLSTDLFDTEHFSVYPNPLSIHSSSIHFTLPSSVHHLEVSVYDITGKLVKTYNNVMIQTGENIINTPYLPQGIYLLRFAFNNGAQTMTKRLIVK